MDRRDLKESHEWIESSGNKILASASQRAMDAHLIVRLSMVTRLHVSLSTDHDAQEKGHHGDFEASKRTCGN